MIRSDLTGVHFEFATVDLHPHTKYSIAEKDNLPIGYKVGYVIWNKYNQYLCLLQWKYGSEQELVKLEPSILGDFLVALQGSLNFTYSMVNIEL